MRSLTRRELIRATGIAGGMAAISGLAAACAPSQAPQGSSSAASPSAAAPLAAATKRPAEALVIGIFGGTQEPLYRKYVVDPLKADHNGEATLAIGTAGARRTKVLAEKGRPSMDLVGLSIADTHEFVVQSVLLPSNPKVAHFDEVEPWATERGYTYAAFSVGLRYNPKKIDAPTSYADLWNPRYKGHVAIPNLAKNAIGPVFLTMISRMLGKDHSNTEDAWKKLQELKPNVVLQYASDPEVNQLWTQQDIWLAVSASFTSWQFQLNDKGEALFVTPKEGGALMGNTVGIPAGTQHQELAELAAGYFLAEPLQRALVEELYFLPTRKSMTGLKPEIQKLLPSPKDLVSLPTLEIARRVPEWSDRWTREMVG